ncbi:RacO protein [Streptomyces sp. SA15]|nr:RacO protein [Streptomyces sp. SA15]
MATVSENVGQVTRQRYEEIVAGDRQLVAHMGRAMFTIGDHAVEIEPMRPQGGSASHSDELFGVYASLQVYADDIGLSLSTVLNYRFTSHRWPADQRREAVSHKVHSILASIQDDAERFKAIDDPPVDDVTGTRRWTTNLAKKRVGRRPDRPGTVQEKVERVHDLAADEEVAVEVTRDVLRRPQVAARLMEDTATRHAVNDAQRPEHRAEAMQSLVKDDAAAARMASDVLRRPEVAARVAADDRARHMVNRAQADRSRQQAEAFRRTSPVGPAVRRIERTEEFVDLLGAFHRFVREASKAVPKMRDRAWSGDEREVLLSNIARTRATLDRMETAVSTGRVDMDEELARILRGE